MSTSVLYDAETGLPGRGLLSDRLLMALRGAERTGQEVGLVLVDLASVENPDGPVTEGDRRAVLKDVGERLTSCVRGVDSVGRIGPATFALVLQGEVGEAGLAVMARRVLFELSPPVIVGLRPHFVLARLGGTKATPGTDDPRAMLHRAGVALQQAQQPDGELFVLYDAQD
ncbi:MAG TPA: GGDEF domain-containing protein [Nocardioides sp.]|nr:GGDEF domain-containing protein [Nocardioides sp.]